MPMSTKPEGDKRKAVLSGEQLRTALDEMLRRVDALPCIDFRSADEILGYDGHGLPA